MRLDFLCPGLGRCGTTTLDNIFRQYKSIRLPYIKEPLYLQNYETSKKDVLWYAKKYYGVDEEHGQDNEVLYGEFNPSMGAIVAKKVYDIFGKNVKILIVMRNPIQRLWAHFNFCINEGRPIMLDSAKDKVYLQKQGRKSMFDTFLQDNFELIGNRVQYVGRFNYILSSQRYPFYYRQYSRFFQNVKLILFEDFISEPEKVCKDICDYLEIDFEEDIDYHAKANEGNYRPKDVDAAIRVMELASKMDEILRNEQDSVASQKYFTELALERKQYMVTDAEIKKERMSETALEWLKKYFRSDKEYVERLLNRDLTEVWF